MKVRIARVLVVLGLAAASLAVVQPLAAQDAPPPTTTVAPATTTTTVAPTTTTVAPTPAVEWPQIGRSIDGVAKSTDSAGWSVSLSDGGSRVAVGYPTNDTAGKNTGEVRVFDAVDGAWVEVGAAIPGSAEGDEFGQSVSLSGDGLRVAVGAPKANSGTGAHSINVGQVRVFDLNAAGTAGAAWVQVGQDLVGIVGNAAFGGSVSLSQDGSRVAVGADSDGDGHVQVFELNAAGAEWVQVGQDLNATTAGQLVGPQLVGASVALSDDGSRVVVGAWGTYGVRVFDLNTAATTWTQEGAGFAGSSFALFRNVSLSGDGSHVAVGDPQFPTGNGKVEVFAQVGTPAVWTVVGAAISGTSAGDEFGRGVSLSRDGSLLAVGAPNATPADIVPKLGQVTVYEKGDAAWTAVRPAFLGASHSSLFGRSVSLSTDEHVVAVGAPKVAIGTEAGQVRVFGADSQVPVLPTQQLVSVVEGQTAVTTVALTDPDTIGVSYAFAGGADDGKFTLDGASGVLAFKAPPDWEIRGDADEDLIYVVEVSATVGQHSATQVIMVNVTDGVHLYFTSPAEFSVEENLVDVGTVAAADPDTVGETQYALVDEADRSKFTIDAASGELSFEAAPDFETPGDADGDNIYKVKVSATADDQTAFQEIKVTVTDVVAEPDQLFPSPVGVSVLEGSTGAFITVDPADFFSGAAVTYALGGGTDDASFALDGASGELSFEDVPDFENPDSAATSNVYVVKVTATAGTESETQTITVTVTDANDNAPVFSAIGRFVNAAENQTAVTTVIAADVDTVGTVTYTLSRENSTKFTLDATTGVLAFIKAPDFEDPPMIDEMNNPSAEDISSGNVYTVDVTASDGVNPVATQTIAVTVTDVNDNAPALEATASVSVAEEQTAVTTVVATDPDFVVIATYSLSGGADQSKFSINEESGALSFKVAPDFEALDSAANSNVYVVEVSASDTVHTAVTQTITVTVTDVDDTDLVFSSDDAVEVVEDTTGAVLTVVAADADTTGAVTYTLGDSDDDEKFSIGETSGELSFEVAPDFETPLDADQDNIYVITVTATLGEASESQVIRVTVTGIDDSDPLFSSPNAVDVVEGTTAVTTVLATDADTAGAVSYTLGDSLDDKKFDISLASGVLTFKNAPDFEARGSAASSNVYVITVTATLGQDPASLVTASQEITVTVTDIDDTSPVLSDDAAVDVEEGQTAVATVEADDVDSDTVTYSVSGGADRLKFSIDATSGELTFIEEPDFEALGSDASSNIYVVEVSASDGDNLAATQVITVTVTDVNDNPPVLEATAAVSVPEGTTRVTTVTATDVDTVVTAIYSVSGGADDEKFSIDATSGELTFIEEPNFEDPTRTGDNANVYVVEVSASDGDKTVATQVITVTVTDVNDIRPVLPADAAVSVAEGTTAVTTVTAIDADTVGTVAYTLGGADGSKFTRDATSGALTFIEAPDFETPAGTGDPDNANVYVVQVTASDGTDPAATQVITVTVTNVNDNPPKFTSPASFTIEEGKSAAATVVATDDDTADTVAYSLSGGTDLASFSIDAASGALTFEFTPDFELPRDLGTTDNVYEVTVTATAGGQSVEQSITVTIRDRNDNTPQFSSSNAFSVAENLLTVGTVVAADADTSDTVTYTLGTGPSAGADVAKFDISLATGVLTFKNAPDFEMPGSAAGSNDYVVQVIVSDGPNRAGQLITVTVTDANDIRPVLPATASVEVPEGTTAVATVVATDADTATSVMYTLGGADGSKFSIGETSGVLTFNTAPDFEVPGSAAFSNVYVVEVTASDGTDPAATQVITVTVTDANDNPPVLEATAAVTVPEGTTRVTTVAATDVDTVVTATYSLSDGADRTKFSIDETSGVLTFIEAPDFEDATRTGDNANVYVVEVTASDGTNPAATQVITVTVTDVNDIRPVLPPDAAVSVAEGTTAVTTVTATDADTVGTVTYTLGGADESKFTRDATSGVLSFKTAPDFEAPGSDASSNVYVVEVTASDGTDPVATQVITVTVTNLNDNSPRFTSPASFTINEGILAAATVEATDADGSTVTYSVSGGADLAHFSIDGTSGALVFNTAPDFETPIDDDADNIYEVTVTATDTVNPVVTQTITVTIVNMNDNLPEFSSEPGFSVAENVLIVGTVVAADADTADTVSYTLGGGDDAAKFTIDGTSGELAFKVVPDYEAPGDVGANNIYEVQVTATAGGQATTQAITVTVTDANDNPPVFPAATAAVEVEEGETAVTTVEATDADGDTVTYSLSDRADDEKFSIDGESGVLTFNTAPDFEDAAGTGDPDNANVYVVEVTASDTADQTATQAITVTVTDLNDNPPVLEATAAVSVAEGTTAVTTVAATDADSVVIATYSLSDGADQSKFSIDETSGELTFITEPDFELPAGTGDSDNANVYVVEVSASDGDKTVATQTITVTVTDVIEIHPACVENANAPHPFTDVPSTLKGSSAIGCIKALGVTTGTSATTYSPHDSVTREQMAAFLGRLYRTVTGKACDSANHPFVDVPRSSYAYGYIGCLKALGVTTGTSATTYSPYEFVTREQMAAFLGRLYREVSGDKACMSTDHGFADVPASSYANGDLGCLKSIEVIEGTSATTYAPSEFVTREQMALVLARLHRVLI